MLLKFIRPDLDLSDRGTAVVGSSHKLAGSGHGSLIDSFDDVVRFNRAPTAGYEDDVGSKTTLRAMNTHVSLNRPIGQGWQAKGQPSDFAKRLRSSRILCWGNYFRTPSNKALRANIHVSNAVHVAAHRELGFPVIPGASRGVTPSVGLGIVLLCVESGIVPHIFGFIIDDDDMRGHYWEPVGPAGGCHDHSKEKVILQQLRDDGRIIVP